MECLEARRETGKLVFRQGDVVSTNGLTQMGREALSAEAPPGGV